MLKRVSYNIDIIAFPSVIIQQYLEVHLLLRSLWNAKLYGQWTAVFMQRTAILCKIFQRKSEIVAYTVLFCAVTV
jgi:hypothetical protein